MNKIDLEGRKAVITGGARGIGLAAAERMLGSGAEVCLWDADAPALDAATKRLAGKGTVHTTIVDVSSVPSVTAGVAMHVSGSWQIALSPSFRSAATTKTFPSSLAK